MIVEKNVENFITDTINSLLMWELLVFIAKNPGVADNADGIAGRIGRRRQDLVELLQTLSEKHILKKWGDQEDPVYTYEPSEDLSELIEKFLKVNDDKEGRIIILSQLLKHGLR